MPSQSHIWAPRAPVPPSSTLAEQCLRQEIQKRKSKKSDCPPGRAHLACCCCQAAQRRRGTHRRQPRQPPGSATQCQEEEEEEQQQHQHHPANHLAVQHNVNNKNYPANLEYIPGFTKKY